MNIISKADVVLALGSRLGPFGKLPQYGFDYWPKTAKVIQVNMSFSYIMISIIVLLFTLSNSKLSFILCSVY